MLGVDSLSGVSLIRRSIVGRTETALDARAPMIVDELSNVVVRLTHIDQLLLNADADAIMAGANVALVGEELIQFGRADQLEPGVYRLSKLMRGRRGTEWAVVGHAAGEAFCMIDLATIRQAELAPSAVGATLKAIAHGIGDVAPLPTYERTISGEAMRPPSPCHLTATRLGQNLLLTWVRRTYRNWAWVDGVGDSPDSFPERYRVTVQGSSGEAIFDTAGTSFTLGLAQLPGQSGQSIAISVVTIGPAALSRAATVTIIL